VEIGKQQTNNTELKKEIEKTKLQLGIGVKTKK